MKLKGIFSAGCIVLYSAALYAKPALDLTGNWKVIDDKSGFTLVKVKISKIATLYTMDILSKHLMHPICRPRI